MSTPSASSEQRYFNRELSWLEFNGRVLEEAQSEMTPLLERLKFLAIFASNLDEFFMVRVAGLKKMIQEDIFTNDYAETSAQRVLRDIRTRTFELCQAAHALLGDTLMPRLAEHGVRTVAYTSLNKRQRSKLDDYFEAQVFPVLTPLAVDSAHPFPFLSNSSLYLLVTIASPVPVDGQKGATMGFIEIPSILPRLIPVIEDPQAGQYAYVQLEDLVRHHLHDLFLGFEVEGVHAVRVTRNLDYELLENETVDLLKSIQREVISREMQEVVRLEVSESLPDDLLRSLLRSLQISSDDVYPLREPLDHRFLMGYLRLPFEELKDPPFNPRLPPTMAKNQDIFTLIRNQDLLVHHPFDSFYTVVEFLQAAAVDPDVLAIKQTLYRTSGDSPIIDALIAAAEAGKQVTAVVELKARFDERNNIVWARRLEKAGVNVVFGSVGMKTHCKVALVVRRERDHIVRYVHLATGNYNSSTAKFYTDIGLFTAAPAFGQDASALFNLLTGFNVLTATKPRENQPSRVPTFEVLKVAPLDLRESLIEAIEHEVVSHEAHGDGHIIAKMNALVDRPIIDALYRASAAGVRIQLIVRGICCLRPGVPGLSESIEVISILDRFLEHSRIYYFHRHGERTLYLSSADWMTRNMIRRIETLFPILDPAIKARIIDEILAVYLSDNVKARELAPDGTYHFRQPKADEAAYRSQALLIEIARAGGIKSIPYDKAIRHKPRGRGVRPVARRRKSGAAG